jgi:hypothetical protein
MVAIQYIIAGEPFTRQCDTRYLNRGSSDYYSSGARLIPVGFRISFAVAFPIR